MPERLADRLLRGGRRLTSSRREVLAAVAAAGDYFTADDILRAVPRAGRATVFRTLRLLLDQDLVCRVVLEDGSTRYRLSASGHHHHLVCNGCGRVEDFRGCDVSGLIGDLVAATDFEIEGHWLEVYGRCGRCRSASSGPH